MLRMPERDVSVYSEMKTMIQVFVELAEPALRLHLGAEPGGAASCITLEGGNGGMLVLDHAGHRSEGAVGDMPCHGSAELPRVEDPWPAVDQRDCRVVIGSELPFKMISARHRLGLIDEAFEARILEARRYFAEHLPPELRGGVEFFDAGRYNAAATIIERCLPHIKQQ